MLEIKRGGVPWEYGTSTLAAAVGGKGKNSCPYTTTLPIKKKNIIISSSLHHSAYIIFFFLHMLNFYSEVVVQKSNLTLYYRAGLFIKLSKLPTTSSIPTDTSHQLAMDWHLNKSAWQGCVKEIRGGIKRKKNYSFKHGVWKELNFKEFLSWICSRSSSITNWSSHRTQQSLNQ